MASKYAYRYCPTVAFEMLKDCLAKDCLAAFLASSLLAELMLPDGAHQRTEDWTIFYLNQTRATTVQKEILAAETGQGSIDDHEASTTGSSRRDLLYVMSLVRTKHSSAYKRCVEDIGRLGRVRICIDFFPAAQRCASQGLGSMQFPPIYSDLQGTPLLSTRALRIRLATKLSMTLRSLFYCLRWRITSVNPHLPCSSECTKPSTRSIPHWPPHFPLTSAWYCDVPSVETCSKRSSLKKLQQFQHLRLHRRLWKLRHLSQRRIVLPISIYRAEETPSCSHDLA